MLSSSTPLVRLSLIAIAAALILSSGCRRRDRDQPDYARPLRPGEVALQTVPSHEWPTFTTRTASRTDLRTGIAHSLDYLGTKSAQSRYPIAQIDHASVVAGLQRFDELLASNASDQSIDAALRREFTLLRSVGWNGQGTVLFTGYYTPIFTASRTRTARFRYPLYHRPDDLVQPAGHRGVSSRQQADGSLVPYPGRAEIERSNMLAGKEIVWLPSAIDAYIIQVQGSAKLRMVDGGELEIGWAGDTGHDYVSIGRELIKDGHISEDQLNLSTIRQFFAANPQYVDTYLHRNPRFVFFSEAPGGPFGSIGRPVTTDVSIATDKRIFPPGALCYVTTEVGEGRRAQPYAGFRLDQDTGGAIRAPGRCDLYMGEGPSAEARAGYQHHEGMLYYLVLKR